MNKQDLIDAVTAKSDLRKVEVEAALDALSTVVTGELAKGNEVTLHGLGKLKVARSAARTGRNPSNGEPIDIPAKNRATFVAAKALKDALN